MRLLYSTALLIAFSLLFSETLPADDYTRSRAKLIEFGWDCPDTEYLKNNWRQMDQESAFDGVVFRVTGKRPTGEGVNFSGMFSPESAWDKAWFTQAESDLAACRFERQTENFVLAGAYPGGVGWTDDAAWQAVCGRAGIAAGIAKRGRAKGVCFDMECYEKPQFRYDDSTNLSWEETKRLAVERGKQFITAIAAEYPDATLLLLWQYSALTRCTNNLDATLADAALKTNGNGLLPSFLDGMLAAAPSGIQLVDGCECAYYIDGEISFQRLAWQIRSVNGPCMRRLPDELKAKYRAQVQVGFGLYLDSYINPAGHGYYFGPLETPNGTGSRLDHFLDNLNAAYNATDGYVWLWGEKGRWWGQPKYGDFPKPTEQELKDDPIGKGRSWETLLPGLTAGIERIKDPAGSDLRQVERAIQDGSAENRFDNGNFLFDDSAEKQTADKQAADKPVGGKYWLYQEPAAGSMVLDTTVTFPGNPGGSLRCEKVRDGAAIQSFKVEPGERYLVRAKVRQTGSSRVGLTIRWNHRFGGWFNEHEDRVAPLAAVTSSNASDSDANGSWQTVEALVEVPAACYKLVAMFSVSRQKDGSKVWLDKLEAYKIP